MNPLVKRVADSDASWNSKPNGIGDVGSKSKKVPPPSVLKTGNSL